MNLPASRLLPLVLLQTTLQMMLPFLPLSSTLSFAATEAASSSPSSDCVILLHGLSRTSFSMQKMQETLESKGYAVSNVHYDSRDGRIEELAQSAISAGLDDCQQYNPRQIHFATHSLGGILVRHYLTHQSVDNLGRVVMLAPPNHGSQIIDIFGRVPGFELISGEPAAQLGTTGPESVPAHLPSVDFELGVIAGDRSISPIFSWALPERDDGKVTVESTRVEGMRDFIVMPYTHTFIMQRQAVIEQVLHFFEHGNFRHDQGNDDNPAGM